jgi:hypothetical protein
LEDATEQELQMVLALELALVPVLAYMLELVLELVLVPVLAHELELV